uniref:CCHC-type domain-containing protein n=1 Tax=Nymphaea colorata TaxID=210225 RepID=A0A5K0XZS8_9MAGN
MATQWNAIAAHVSVKLNRDNYLLWSSQLESVMESQELIQFIDGTFPAPSETIVKDGKSEVNPEFTVWKRSDRLSLSWIKATVSEPVLRQIVTSKSAFEAWNTLKKSFSSQSPLRIMLLRKELHFIQKGNMDMQTYLERIKFLADTLSAAGLDTTDGDLVQITMNGLPIEYESFVTLISTNSSNASITFSELFDLLLTQEKRLTMFKSARVDPHKSIQALPQVENQIAFNTFRGRGRGRGGFRGRQGGRFQGRGNRPHIQTQPPQNGDSNNNTGNGSHPRTIITCQYCGRKGHSARTCYDIPRAFSAMSLQESTGEYWYPDSGATNHIVNNDEMMHNKTTYDGSDNIMIGNG